MKKTLSNGAKMELIKLRLMLQNDWIKDYSDFKEVPIGGGKVSYKFTPIKPVKRLTLDTEGVAFFNNLEDIL